MQAVGRRYVRYFNLRHGRTGTLWEGRYKSTLIQAERYLLACMVYIDLNPVRAGMVARSAADYPWSSHRYYVGPARGQAHHAASAVSGSWAIRRLRASRLIRTWSRAGITGSSSNALTDATLPRLGLRATPDYVADLQRRLRRVGTARARAAARASCQNG